MKLDIKKMGVYLLSLLVMCLWGMSLIWTDRLKPFRIPPEYFLTFRIFVAGCLLLVFNWITKESMRIRSWRDFRLFLLISLFEPLIYFLAETYGLFLVDSPSISALVLGLNPVFALFFGILFFREKIRLINVIGLVLTICGLAFVVLLGADSGESGCENEYYFLGIMVLLIAVLSEVSYASMTKRLATGGTDTANEKASYAPSVIVMYQFLIGTVFMIPMFLLRHENPGMLAEEPYLVTFDPEVYLSWDVLYPLLSLAVICSCLCFSLWAFCIKHLGVARSGNFIAITPVFTALLCWVLGREVLTIEQWLGIVLSIFGLVLTQHTGHLRIRRLFLKRRFIR